MARDGVSFGLGTGVSFLLGARNSVPFKVRTKVWSPSGRSLVVFILGLFLVGLGSGAIDLSSGYWETTYDCAEWEYGQTLDCDGMASAGGWTMCGHGEQITSAANNPAGVGRGQRHWVNAGANQNSGGIGMYFDNPPSEFWLRWYMRYPVTFQWGPYLQGDKILYIYLEPRSADCEIITVFAGHDGFTLIPQGMSEAYATQPDTSSGGWDTTMNTTDYTADGLWHYYEIHVKLDTDGTNGVAETWIDGRKIIDVTGVNFGGLSRGNIGVNSILIASNQKYVLSTCQTVDFDDIAISTTGYIGPISGSGAVCGDGSCDSGESCSSCLVDCGCSSPNICCSSQCGLVPSCPNCDDGNSCTIDSCVGFGTCSPACQNVQVSSCADGDGCCPSGCVIGNDDDCSAASFCGDGSCDSGETCSSCSVDCGVCASPGEVFFFEGFEDLNLASRGWYDNPNSVLSSSEYVAGSSSLEFHWDVGDTQPDSGGSVRHLFNESEEVYVSYWVKYSASYTGSDRAYHPHEFMIMTTENYDYKGPANTHLTAYIEQNEGVPKVAVQDGENIDAANVNVDLTGVSENRSVAGCNGDSDGHGGDCYFSGAWQNGKDWNANGVYFSDSAGLYYKNDWHFIEAYFKLNSILNGIGLADGEVKYWYDGVLLVDHDDVLMRTGQYPNMKFNQFLIGPYIGDGSPVDQSMWVDDLTVGSSRSSSSSEICGNGIDDDGDGLVDCLDGDCLGVVAEICGNGVDEDCDGFDLACVCAHEADLDCDGVVSVEELGGYIDLWLGGGMSISEVMSAIVEWTRGR